MTRAMIALGVSLGAASCGNQLPPPPFDGAQTDARVSETTAASDTLATVWCREHQGNIVIESRDDLETYRLVRKLTGSVVSLSPEGIWNEDLRELTGDFIIEGTAAAPVSAHVSMTGLFEIGGDLSVGYTGRGILDFGRLEHLGGRLRGQVGRWVVHAPKLMQVGGIELHDARVDHLDLRALHTSLGPIRIEHVEGLTELSLPALATIGGPGDALVVDHLQDLATIDMTSLARVSGNVRFTNNPRLTRTTIHDALDGVVVTGALVVCGNAGEDPCL